MIYGFCGKSQSDGYTCTKIWQLLDIYWNHKNGYRDNIPRESDVDYVIRCSKHTNSRTWEFSNWKHESFTDKLKQIISIITGCTIEQLEDNEFRNSLVPEWMTLYHLPGQGVSTKSFTVCGTKAFELRRTYNELLEHIETNLFKNMIHPDIHINMLFQEYTKKHPDTNEIVHPNWIISDVRFLNETKAIKDKGGKIIKMISSTNNDGYQSEIELERIKPDYTINNSTIEDLIISIKDIMITEGIIKP